MSEQTADTGGTSMLGRRVVMTGDHPWVGYSGKVYERGHSGSVGSYLKVKLDNGQRVMTFPGQWKLVPNAE